MEFQKLTIHVEGKDEIKALFNPNNLAFSKSVQWIAQPAKKRDVPELDFENGNPRSLILDLFFDTYDTPDPEKKSVRDYTDKLFKLALVYGELHRPPVCELSWGKHKVFFKGVLASLDQKFTLFMEDGTPVRATCKCTFKEWRKNPVDQKLQDNQSSDLAKKRILKRGDTLSNIAAAEYWDPSLWRPIAEGNDMDDPSELDPGTVLLIPALKNRPSRRST